MNAQTRQDILIWAQRVVNLWDTNHEDYWEAYNEEWDINIWDSCVFGKEKPQGLCVTAYRIIKTDDGDILTDMENSVRIGCFERTA